MSNWAYIENNQIIGLYFDLPDNWRNISNFFALADNPELLQTLGWYPVVQVVPEYDPDSQELGDPVHEVSTNSVIETYLIREIIRPEQSTLINLQWEEIRKTRDKIMSENDWRYNRYDRQLRLGNTCTDNLVELDNFMQNLADVTSQADPFNVVWPVLTNNN
jgi:hypothetical protein